MVISADNLNLPQASESRRRVLIAEDEILIRMDIADTLREQGWEVVETGTADDALAVLARSTVRNGADRCSYARFPHGPRPGKDGETVLSAHQGCRHVRTVSTIR